jgi:hypothetical protein
MAYGSPGAALITSIATRRSNVNSKRTIGSMAPAAVAGALLGLPACSGPDDAAAIPRPLAVAPQLTTLSPGVMPRLDSDLDVNVVFLGFRPGGGPRQIDDARFRAQLATHSVLAGGDAAGNTVAQIAFRLRPHVVYAPPWYEDAVFAYLKAIGIRQTTPFDVGPGTPSLPISPIQYIYDFCNLSAGNLGCDFGASAARANQRMITSTLYIHAPAVERALAASLSAIGVDPRSPTLVLMNWSDRPDFVDHHYMKVNEPQVDTGAELGYGVTNLLGGWGGTAADDPEDCPSGCPVSRLFFLDLSASPTILNWDLVAPRQRSEDPGPPQYRLPPIWDYGSVGYRPFDDLTDALADKIVNDVFISELVNANPVYPTELGAPRLPSQLELNVNHLAWNPPVDPSRLWKPAVATAILDKLPYSFSVDAKTAPGMDTRRLQDVLGCWSRSYPVSTDARSCYGGRLGTAQADLYFYFRDHLAQYLDGGPVREIPIFIFDLPDALQPLITGFADQTWSDELRQSFIYIFGSPQLRQPPLPVVAGYTPHVVHETGHHVGLSHPHNGFRCLDEGCTQVRWFGAEGDTYYTWLADQVSSVMSYIHVNDDFSQFDRDNMARYRSYDFLWMANEILAKLLASPRAGDVSAAIADADAAAASALAAYRSMDYEQSVTHAATAHRLILGAADAIGVNLDPKAWEAAYRSAPGGRQDLRRLLRESVADPQGRRAGGSLRAVAPLPESIADLLRH